MKKRILLLASPYMDIYKDIILYLEKENFEVVWVEDSQIKYNPYNFSSKGVKTKTREQYDAEVKVFWTNELEREDCRLPFDYMLAIDGMMASKYLFEQLRAKNPLIKIVLYLYDRIKDNYELDVFFKYYDKVFTFDRLDADSYNLNLLPIYWIPTTNIEPEIYDIFGLASYSPGLRFDIYSKVKSIAKNHGLRDYIKLWHSPIGNKYIYTIKYAIKKAMGLNMLSPSELKNEIFTNKSLNPTEFRKVILQSKVILDTQNPKQDGLTARCMWALGYGKKIITTNTSVKEYTFYTPEQFYIIENNTFEGIIDFINKPLVISDEIKNIIENYRIDNWLNTLLAD